MTEYTVLIGSTVNNTIVFAEIGVCRGTNPVFTVSFKEVAPFIASDREIRERAENSLNSFDKETLYDLCERYQCAPNDLVDNYIDEGIDYVVDISLYPESYQIKGIADDIYFDSVACGQHDTRQDLIPINKEFSDWLHKMWDEYHLKVISKELENEVIENVRKYILLLGDEEVWIKNWLETEVYPQN